jgi:hypothetical protein
MPDAVERPVAARYSKPARRIGRPIGRPRYARTRSQRQYLTMKTKPTPIPTSTPTDPDSHTIILLPLADDVRRAKPGSKREVRFALYRDGKPCSRMRQLVKALRVVAPVDNLLNHDESAYTAPTALYRPSPGSLIARCRVAAGEASEGQADRSGQAACPQARRADG